MAWLPAHLPGCIGSVMLYMLAVCGQGIHVWFFFSFSDEDTNLGVVLLLTSQCMCLCVSRK